MNIPDHPRIARAIATGHPEPIPDPVCCDECSREFQSDDKIFLYDDEHLCENCCRDRIMEDFDMEDIARALDITVKSLARYIEQNIR